MRRYLRCPGAICCPARRALRAVLHTHPVLRRADRRRVEPTAPRMRRLSPRAGCGGCSVGGKPGRCLQDSVSTNRGTRVRHQPRPRPTARSRFSSSSGSVSTGSKSRARRPDAPAWEATAAHLRAGPAGVLVEGAFACVRLRDSFRVSLGFPQENRSANSRAFAFARFAPQTTCRVTRKVTRL